MPYRMYPPLSGWYAPYPTHPKHPGIPGPWTDREGPELMSARNPIPIPWLPVPCPWLVETIVWAVGVKQLATTLPNGAQMQKSADAAIAQVFDDYCGTPPRLVPWPWPGPPPWAYEPAILPSSRARPTILAARRSP
jgi:hypothetical protein